MELEIHLTAVTPLCMHNIRLANPHDEYTQQIKRITSKSPKQKTEQDAFDVERLEWMGGLYHDEANGYYLEATGIKRCFQEAAKATRQGAHVRRGFRPLLHFVPLQFPHRDLTPAELWDHTDAGLPKAFWFDGSHPYRFWKMVRVTGMVARMRPIFPQWSVTFAAELDSDMLDLDVFQEIVERAGVVEGLYEARAIGMGRFQATITAAGVGSDSRPRGKAKRAAAGD